MPRDAVVEVLETARGALHGSGTALEAQLTASLARELHHSVPAHRPRAWPLSEQALTLARTLRDPTALATCLLARHDVLELAGTGNHDRDSRPLLDATARAAYRRRLAELDEDLATAQAD